MAFRIPIYHTQSAFTGVYSVNTALNAIANAPGLYSVPSGEISIFRAIFGGTPFHVSPTIGRRITRMVVRTKTNVFRGSIEWAPIILVGPSEARFPINGWQLIGSFCYNPNLPLVPPDGYYEYEYLYEWPNLPPQAYGVEIRGVYGTGTIPPNGTQFVEFQFWDDGTPTPPSPGGGGDPPVPPSYEIPYEDLETQSYENLGGSGVRTIPNSSAANGGSAGIVPLQFDVSSTFPDKDSIYGDPFRLLQYTNSTNILYAWRSNIQVSGDSVDLTGCYVEFKFRGFVRKITKTRINYAKEGYTSEPTFRFIGSNDGETWVNLTEEFSLADSNNSRVNTEVDFIESEDRFKHIRFVCVSGFLPQYETYPIYIFYIEFEISGVPWEKGDRRSVLSIESNIAKYSVGAQGGSAANMFDNLFNTAFDGTSWWYWVSSGNGPGSYALITFPSPIKLRSFLWFSDASNPSNATFNQGEWVLQGSNNKYNWHDLKTFTRESIADVKQPSIVIEGELLPYKFYKLLCTGGSAWNTTQSEANFEWQFDIEGVYNEPPPVEPLVEETMSYNNLGGSGSRADGLEAGYTNINNLSSWTLEISTTFTFNSTRNLTRLIDGTANNNSVAYAFAWLEQGVAGKEIRFSMRGRPRVIDEFTWKQSVIGSHGIFKFQGSNDGEEWDTLADDFELGVETVQVVSFENTERYYHYRLLGVSGTTDDNPWLQEITFRISGLPFEKGARVNLMKISTDLAMYASDSASTYKIENLIDGTYGSTNAAALPGYGWRPATNQNVTGKHITFEFPYQVRVIGIYLLQSGDNSELRPAGTWAVMLSDDGEEWETVGTIELEVAGGQGWHSGPEAKGKPARYLRLFGLEGSTDLSARYWREFEFEFALPQDDPFEVDFIDDGEFYAEVTDVSWENLSTNFIDDGELYVDITVTGESFDVNLTDKTELLVELITIHINPDYPIVQVIPNHAS